MWTITCTKSTSRVSLIHIITTTFQVYTCSQKWFKLRLVIVHIAIAAAMFTTLTWYGGLLDVYIPCHKQSLPLVSVTPYCKKETEVINTSHMTNYTNHRKVYQQTSHVSHVTIKWDILCSPVVWTWYVWHQGLLRPYVTPTVPSQYQTQTISQIHQQSLSDLCVHIEQCWDQTVVYWHMRAYTVQ